MTLVAGMLSVSEQAFDRGGAAELGFDEIVFAQLREQLDAQIDLAVLNAALANVGTVTDSTAFGIQPLYSDLTKARENIANQGGTKFKATHLFTTSNIFGAASSLLDAATGRPLIVPDAGALVAASGDPKWAGYTGVHMPGALSWFTNDNIPNSSGNTQLIVSRPSTVVSWETLPMTFSYVETEASTLSVVVGLRAYVGAIARYPKAVQVITGSTYLGSLS
jgi:hypothetical protein